MITSKYQRAKCQRISHSPGLHKHLCTQDFFVHFFNVIKFNWKKGKNITAFCLNNSQREHTEEKLFFIVHRNGFSEIKKENCSGSGCGEHTKPRTFSIEARLSLFGGSKAP